MPLIQELAPLSFTSRGGEAEQLHLAEGITRRENRGGSQAETRAFLDGTRKLEK